MALTNIYEKNTFQPIKENFDASEFHCKCNYVQCGHTLVYPKLLEVLQFMREDCAKPIVITSAFRCQFHNRDIGGASKSQHMQGKAADIIISGLSVDEMAALAKKHGATGIGRYYTSGFVHIDVRESPASWIGN